MAIDGLGLACCYSSVLSVMATKLTRNAFGWWESMSTKFNAYLLKDPRVAKRYKRKSNNKIHGILNFLNVNYFCS